MGKLKEIILFFGGTNNLVYLCSILLMSYIYLIKYEFVL